MNLRTHTMTPFERSRLSEGRAHTVAGDALGKGDDTPTSDDNADTNPFAATCEFALSDTRCLQTPHSRSTHDLPLEIWSLIVAQIMHSMSTDPQWRLHLARLAHTCRSAYYAAFPVLWSHLHLQFIRNNTELSPTELTIANAAEYHDDPHLKYRLGWIRHARRQFDAGMVFPTACTRADHSTLSQMASISECLLLAPLVVHGGRPYLVSLVKNENRGVDLAHIRGSIQLLWGPFLSTEPTFLDSVSILNGLVLVPFPLHLVKHIAINDLDTSVDLGVDLLYPNTLTMEPNKQSISNRKPSWSHVVPFLLTLPARQVVSIRFLTSSPSASRLKAELVDRYQWAQDFDVAYSGDHEHNFSSMTQHMRNIRLFLDGDLDSATSTASDLFICTPPSTLSCSDMVSAATAVTDCERASALNVGKVELLGRTSCLPFDEPTSGLRHLFTLPFLTSLVLDVDFDFDHEDAGVFPIHLPKLTDFTLTMRISTLLFSQSHHLLDPPQSTKQPAFPSLQRLTLLNDLDVAESSSSPTAISTALIRSPVSPLRLPVIPRIPFSHMPALDEFIIPATFRGLLAPCALDMTRANPLQARTTRLPNVVFLGAHMFAHVKDIRPAICDSLRTTSKRLEAQYAMHSLAFANLRSLGLHVWDWAGDPRRTLPECAWREQLQAIELVFDGPRVWGANWMAGLSRFSSLQRLTLSQSVRVPEMVSLAMEGEGLRLEQLQVLTLRFANAPGIDFSGVAIGAAGASMVGARLHLPNLRTLVIQAPQTIHLPPASHLAQLARISVLGPPCPRLIEAVLLAASLSSVHVTFEPSAPPSPSMAATTHDQGYYYQPVTLDDNATGPRPPPTATDCGTNAGSSVVFPFTPRNQRVWHALLTACSWNPADVPGNTGVTIGGRLDAVDARTIVRVLHRLLGGKRMGKVDVSVPSCVVNRDTGSLVHAQWVAHHCGNGQVVVRNAGD